MNLEAERFLEGLPEEPFAEDNYEKYCAKRKLVLSSPVIHVSGSSGKSCVLRYLEAIYLAAGYRVAALERFCFGGVSQSIRFEGKPIEDAELSRLLKDNRKDIEKFGLSRFGALVALAYRYFQEKKPDLVIVEAGLGGTYDPTNLESLDTRLSLITSVSLDHTAELGTTLSQIALHFAGTIKPESLVLTGVMEETCLDTVRDAAREARSKSYRVEAYHFEHLVEGKFHFDYGPYKDLVLSSEAYYQVGNASLAIEAIRLLQEDFPVKEEAVRQGLEQASMPGRLERFGRVTVDAAHNPEQVIALARCARTVGRGKPVHALFASLREKNIAVELPRLADAVNSITLTSFDHPDARGEMEFALYAADHPFIGDPKEALKTLLESYPEDAVLVTGSNEFVALMRDALLNEDFPL